jgi:hypothetical protein
MWVFSLRTADREADSPRGDDRVVATDPDDTPWGYRALRDSLERKRK